jgi:maltooligosyltrehalose trehalohydrolase
MGEEYGEQQPFQYFCSFEGRELIEAVRQGRKREFEAFHAAGAEAPDPQSEATFTRSRLTWSWQDSPSKAGLRQLYRDLLEARRLWPALRNYSERTAALHRGPHGPVILELVRGGVKPDAENTLQIVCNLTADSHPLPGGHSSTLLLSSEAKQYDGKRGSTLSDFVLMPFEAMVFGPADWRKYDSAP